MKLKVIFAAAVVFAMATSAQAVSLVVMATNTTALAGAKVFTIGVKVTAADVAAGGTNAVVFAQNVTFTGNGFTTVATGSNPFNQTGGANRPDIQTIQTAYIDTSAGNNAGPPSANLGSVAANNAFYRDSWWYNSGTATLEGVIDAEGNSGTVTTNPAPDASGVYTLGAPNSGTTAVGPTGYLFSPSGSPGVVPANATAGQTMQYSGLYGPTGLNYFDAGHPGDPAYVLGNMLIANGGSLTIPLAQIVATGNIQIPSSYQGGAGTFLVGGSSIYNVLGGSALIDPQAVLDYATGTIVGVPEPSTLVLCGIAGLGLLIARRRRQS